VRVARLRVDSRASTLRDGDGKIGEAVPGSPGKVFGDGCSVK